MPKIVKVVVPLPVELVVPDRISFMAGGPNWAHYTEVIHAANPEEAASLAEKSRSRLEELGLGKNLRVVVETSEVICHIDFDNSLTGMRGLLAEVLLQAVGQGLISSSAFGYVMNDMTTLKVEANQI